MWAQNDRFNRQTMIKRIAIVPLALVLAVVGLLIPDFVEPADAAAGDVTVTSYVVPNPVPAGASQATFVFTFRNNSEQNMALNRFDFPGCAAQSDDGQELYDLVRGYSTSKTATARGFGWVYGYEMPAQVAVVPMVGRAQLLPYSTATFTCQANIAGVQNPTYTGFYSFTPWYNDWAGNPRWDVYAERGTQNLRAVAKAQTAEPIGPDATGLTITSTPKPASELPADGGPYHYEYAITNKSAYDQMIVSVSDSQCTAAIQGYDKLPTKYDSANGRYIYYIARGSTATLTCATNFYLSSGTEKSNTVSAVLTPIIRYNQTPGSADGPWAWDEANNTRINASSTVTIADPIGAEAAQQDNNGNKAVTITSTPSESTIVAPGGDITYTYKLTNNSKYPQRLVEFNDNRCSNPTGYQLANGQGLPQLRDHDTGNSFSYIPAGSTMTATCTTLVRQTVTNTVTADLTPIMAYGDINNDEWASSEENDFSVSNTSMVTVESTAKFGCSTLWFSSDARWYVNNNNYWQVLAYGGLGTITTSGIPTSQHTITPKSPNYYPSVPAGNYSYPLQGSAAVAVSPANPNLIYYVPRYELGMNSVFSGLWVWDASSNVKTQLTTNGLAIVRLGVDPNGTVWMVNQSAGVQSYDPKTRQLVNRGTIQPSDGNTFVAGQNRSLNSGDLAFDGDGNMWIIGSQQLTNEAHLYLATWKDLTDGNGITAKPVGETGDMGKGQFNGIAFTNDGRLWATSRNATNATGSFWEINKDTGAATKVKDLPENYTGDLGSCALPRAELTVKKEIVGSEKAVGIGDTITYRITAENLGFLSSINSTIKDALPNDVSYVSNSTVLNPTINDDDLSEPGSGVKIGDRANGGFPLAVETPINSSGVDSGIIAPQQKAIIEFKVKVIGADENGQVCNQGNVVYLGSDEGGVTSHDPGGADQTCWKVVQPKLELTKSVDQVCLAPDADPATPVTFTYQLSNLAGATADLFRNINVTDTSCADIRYVSGDAPLDGQNTGNYLLDPGETWTYTCSQGLTKPVTPSGSQTSAKGFGLFSGDTITAHVSNKDQLTVDYPALTTTKSVVEVDENGKPVPSMDTTLTYGDYVQYTVTVTNMSGQGGDKGRTDAITASNISVTDSLPEGVTYVAGSLQRKGIADPGGWESPQTWPEGGVLIKPGEAKSLNAGAQAVLTFRARINNLTSQEGAILINEVTARYGTVTDGTYDASFANCWGQDKVRSSVSPPPVDFQVAKVSTNCDTDAVTCPLSGARFELYKANPLVPIPGSNPAQYPEPIITRDTAKPDSSADPPTNGNALFSGVSVGQYWLVESKAPLDHNLLPGAIPIVLQTNGVFFANADGTIMMGEDNKPVLTQGPVSITNDQPVFTVTVTDTTPAPLPKMGGSGFVTFLLLGFLLICGGSMYLFKISHARCAARRASVRITPSNNQHKGDV